MAGARGDSGYYSSHNLPSDIIPRPEYSKEFRGADLMNEHLRNVHILDRKGSKPGDVKATGSQPSIYGGRATSKVVHRSAELSDNRSSRVQPPETDFTAKSSYTPWTWSEPHKHYYTYLLAGDGRILDTVWAEPSAFGSTSAASDERSSCAQPPETDFTAKSSYTDWIWSQSRQRYYAYLLAGDGHVRDTIWGPPASGQDAASATLQQIQAQYSSNLYNDQSFITGRAALGDIVEQERGRVIATERDTPACERAGVIPGVKAVRQESFVADSELFQSATNKDTPASECAGDEPGVEVVRRDSVRKDPESLRSASNIATSEQNVGGRRRQSSHDDQVCLPFVTHTIKSRNYSTRSSSSGTDVLGSLDGLSDDSNSNYASDIAVEKEQILDRLMLCVHDMFASAGSSAHNTCAGSESHRSKKQTGGLSANSSDQVGKKRTGSKESGDSNSNEEGNDGSRKRRKEQEETNNTDQKKDKMLACPYHKRNPFREFPSNRCSGPGWNSVHRLKEHLHRVHSMPLHCRRCYITFDNENQLNEHSRLEESCSIREKISMEGFNKDQEKELKSRRAMFRAGGSEEKKWQTDSGAKAAQDYDADEDSLCERPESGSPQSSELGQISAYMKRELPAMVRRTLRAILDRDLGSIEETLETQLPNIVRESYELCAQNYLNSTQPSKLLPSTINGPAEEPRTAEISSTTAPKAWNSIQPPYFRMDALSLFSIPPDASSSYPPWLLPLVESTNTVSSFPDSAYQSNPVDAESECFNEAWLGPNLGSESAWDNFIGDDPAGYTPNLLLDDPPTEEYTGKGKGRADPGSNPWVSDRSV